MGLSYRRLLRFLGATIGVGALMIALPAMAGAFSLIELPTLTITKECAGLAGTVTLSLSVSRNNDNVGASFSQQVNCGESVKIVGIPNGEGTALPLAVGDTITITETQTPAPAVLSGGPQTVTLAAGANLFTVLDSAAVSIHKTCAAGVSGKA